MTSVLNQFLAPPLDSTRCLLGEDLPAPNLLQISLSAKSELFLCDLSAVWVGVCDVFYDNGFRVMMGDAFFIFCLEISEISFLQPKPELPKRMVENAVYIAVSVGTSEYI